MFGSITLYVLGENVLHVDIYLRFASVVIRASQVALVVKNPATILET